MGSEVQLEGLDEGRFPDEATNGVDVIELDEEASDLEKAQAAVGEATHSEVAGDPLSALLAVDTSAPIQAEVYIPRLKTRFVIQGFQDDRDYEMVLERATNYVKRRGGPRQKEVDNRRLAKLLVMERVVSPPFSPRHGEAAFRQLAEKFGSEDPETLVGRALLPGEIDLLGDKILELSGYSDELEAAAGN